ncbi:response regulator [Solirubrum puertoriconensis]|uniref:Response regulatory domain-containing protein n=1 Tax=Solirubrum puertoriconensis TaxID=1751427 RepID=A0A9X0HMK1_SOLP1|nr:response regulator [Solirubrum puertoriconensis]KUG08708.1 hypothetical protein ASU33_11240 [Solirubrum puertoriconensis]
MPDFPRTLLVDDDGITNFLNQRLFQQMGITDTQVALNGQDALDLLQTVCDQSRASECPALILLDLKMPVMDGVQFLHAYLQRPPIHPAPVIIVLSTSHNPDDLARLQNLPIAGYLTKPLTREKLAGVIQTHFGYSYAS